MSWFSRLLGKRVIDADDDAVIVPIPPLVTILHNQETLKGSPLSEEEVLEIRDNAVCMTMARSRAAQLTQSRGYADIDPEHAWRDWQRMREGR